MKDDDSSSIVRSQTAHQVNVSEYSGNATTPQNHVTSDVDREIAISEGDVGPTREINTDAATRIDDAPITEASDPIRVEANAPTPAVDPAYVPVDAFQDELAAIERARDIHNRQRVPTEPAIADPHAVLPTAVETAHFEAVPTEPPMAEQSVGDTKPTFSEHHAMLPEQGETSHKPEVDLAELGHDHPLGESLLAEQHAALPAAAETPHLEAVPSEPPPPEHSVGEAKPVFSDSHALLPEQGEALHDPELDLAERGHAHPLSDPDHDATSQHTPPPHLHTPHSVPSPASTSLADLNKDEFQGRLAGIKREVQALNNRLTDFEAELDKDGMRPARP